MIASLDIRAFGKVFMLTVVIVVGALADWGLKLAARSQLLLHEPIAVWPGFNLTLGINRGIAFGFFPAESSWTLHLLITLQMFLIAGLLYMVFRTTDFVVQLSLALTVAGAVANVVDRVIYGGVTDFLDFYFQKWHWPAFNLADMLIFVGVSVILCTRFSGIQPKGNRGPERVSRGAANENGRL